MHRIATGCGGFQLKDALHLMMQWQKLVLASRQPNFHHALWVQHTFILQLRHKPYSPKVSSFIRGVQVSSFNLNKFH